MPQQIIKYRIFIASPSDLTEERDSIDNVVKELNQTFGNHNNSVIEIVKWETHSAPAITSSYIQEIINNDIGEYDLFIGLIWKKFGTPTEKYSSGTEEEFMIAYDRFISNPNSSQILFYFKKGLVSLDDIDPEQIKKIKDFKLKLAEKNVLYWEFETKNELESFLRLHIPKRLENLNSQTHLLKTEAIPLEVDNDEQFEDELGSLDYLEMFNQNFEDSSVALNEISNSTAWIGVEFGKLTKEIEIVIKNKNGQSVSHSIQRDFYNRAAKVLDAFSSKIEIQIPMYVTNFENGIDSLTKLIAIYKSDFVGKEEEITEIKESLISLITQISSVIPDIKSFYNSIEKMPRVSKEFNKSRKNALDKIGTFLKKLEIMNSLASESLQVFELDII